MKKHPPAPDQPWYATPEMKPLLIMLGLAVAAGVALRFAFLHQPVAGFHMFNEGFYMDLATRDAARGLLAWITEPLDQNNPPLYGVIVATLFRIFGVATTWARLVSAVAGLGTIIFTFLLGRTLFTPRIGVIAAALVAITPGLAVLDHNIQVDALFLCFLMGGAWLYVLAARSGRTRDALLGGAMLGLAMATKQSAVVAFAALALWETWRGPGLKWLAEKRTWLFVAGFVATGVPWFAAQLAIDGSAYIARMTALSGSRGVPVFSSDFPYVFGVELAFLLSATASVVFVIALVVGIRKRTSADRFVLSFLAVYGAFYVMYHMHSYYLIVLAPFAMLAVARALSGLFSGRRGVALGVTGVLLASMALSGLVMLSSQKWSGWAPASLKESIVGDPGRTVIFATFDCWGNVGPALTLENPELEIVNMPEGQLIPEPSEVPPGKTALVLSSPLIANATGMEVVPYAVPQRERLKPVLFGSTVWHEPFNTNYFGNRAWQSERVGSLLRFGFERESIASSWRIYDADVLRAAAMGQ